MPIKKLWLSLPLILLSGFTLGLNGCETVEIKNRQPCYINGAFSLGSTCSNTVLDHSTWQLTPQQTLDALEGRPEMTDPVTGAVTPAHAPGIFQSADDYGEETMELETACRILGDQCTYELKQTIEARNKILSQMKTLLK